LGKRTDSLASSFCDIRVLKLTFITTAIMVAEMQDVKLSGNHHLSILALFLTFISIVLIPFFLKKNTSSPQLVFSSYWVVKNLKYRKPSQETEHVSL
jgi:hypothetical protein